MSSAGCWRGFAAFHADQWTGQRVVCRFDQRMMQQFGGGPSLAGFEVVLTDFCRYCYPTTPFPGIDSRFRHSRPPAAPFTGEISPTSSLFVRSCSVWICDALFRAAVARRLRAHCAVGNAGTVWPASGAEATTWSRKWFSNWSGGAAGSDHRVTVAHDIAGRFKRIRTGSQNSGSHSQRTVSNRCSASFAGNTVDAPGGHRSTAGRADAHAATSTRTNSSTGHAHPGIAGTASESTGSPVDR